MDYEKKYNEAIEQIRKMLKPWSELAYNGKTFLQDLESIFPELRESEDERIRKELIDTIWNACSGGGIRISKELEHKYISYLEKQKEQEPPLMDGDADLYFDEWNQQQQNPTKRQCFEEGMRYSERLQKEQKPAEQNNNDQAAADAAAAEAEQAKKDGIEGMVYVRFVVEVDGSVTEAEVVRGIGGGCDEEALRVVNAMPKWKPGKQNAPAPARFVPESALRPIRSPRAP